jgi:hypothetical protein
LQAWLLAEIVAATQAYCGIFHILKFVALAHLALQIVGAIVPMAPLAQRREPSAGNAREAFWMALRDARDRDRAAEAARG